MGKFFLIVACCLFVFGSDVFAITDEEIFRNFQFSFVNPGARSGAMGGAFIGLADDATAAEANPAGLTILTKPEVSFEYRNTQFDASRLDAFNSVGASEELFLSVLSANTLEDLNQPSFLGVVFPIGRSTLAFSRQEVSRTEGGINDVFLIEIPGTPTIVFGTVASQDQTIVNYNFSFGTKLGDHFSVGATGRYSQLDWKASVQNLFIDDFGNAFVIFNTDLDDSDSAFAWNAGALYTAANFSFGAVYKKNPKFEVEEVESGPISRKPGSFVNTLKVPDTFGFGVAVKPNDKITIVADLVRLEYSDLVEGIEVGRHVLTAFVTGEDISYTIDDAWDFHVGTEFVVFAGSVPIALRTGYYNHASSSLVVDAAPGLIANDEAVIRGLFSEREDEHHFTIGNGFVFGPHFQIDWAVDIANIPDQFILSTVVRF